ncbi:hypothetical protein HU751_005675 [Pseudomonas sp. BW13M1]|uniref:Uncharacterized protein n=1 Tax=Pseudomonas peradeniyensis TaxID=2745488 RepID=A0A923G7X6_9PSED|nr:hypothetical protein [Pseudomonas peradeniyensis]MBV4504330.1 hypothetical protein [Pseudomonas peradeniyensis]
MVPEHATPPTWLSPLLRVLGGGPLAQPLDREAYWRLLHLWQSKVVLPRLAEALPEHAPAVVTLQRLHQRASLGLRGRIGEWRAAFRPVLLPTFRRAYDFEGAYAQAYDSALAYGRAPSNQTMIAGQFGDAEAFARHYAQLSTEANAQAFATANAAASSEVAARAYAHADEQACASVVGALARVCGWACATSIEQRMALVTQLATGLQRLASQLNQHTSGREAWINRD